jgi:hypothetical protein
MLLTVQLHFDSCLTQTESIPLELLEGCKHIKLETIEIKNQRNSCDLSKYELLQSSPIYNNTEYGITYSFGRPWLSIAQHLEPHDIVAVDCNNIEWLVKGDNTELTPYWYYTLIGNKESQIHTDITLTYTLI